MAEGELTTTGIDALVEYLNAHGETEENKLAAELKVSEKVIEDWSGVLERANVVKISYKVGKMYVAPLGVSGAEVSTYKATLSTKRQSVETEIVAEINVLEEMERRIGNISKVVSGADLLFKKNAGALKRDLDELDHIERESQRHFSGIKIEKERIEKISSTLDTEMRALEEIAGKIKGFSAGEGDIKNIVNDVKEKMRRYETLANEFNKNFERMVKEKREEIERFNEQTHSEMKALQEVLERQLKQMGDNERLGRYAKHESEKLKIQAEKDRTAILNNLEKAKKDINAAFPLADKRMQNVSSKILELKKSFGELSAMNGQINSMKEDIDKIRQEQQSLSKEADTIRSDIKALEYAKKSEVEKAGEIEKLSSKISKVKDKAKELEDKVGKAKSDVDSLAGEMPEGQDAPRAPRV